MPFYMTGRVPASWACNYLQNVVATTYKKFLQFYAKRSCKKHYVAFSHFHGKAVNNSGLFHLYRIIFYIHKTSHNPTDHGIIEIRFLQNVQCQI